MHDLLPEHGTLLLVVPLDSGAPQGRLILPQVQTIRDSLDGRCLCLVVTEEQLPQEEETEKEAEAPAEEVPEETEEKPEEEKNDEPDAEEDKEAEPAVSEEEPRENKEEQADTQPQESQRLEMDETAGGETIDLHETTAHAAARLREEEESGIRTDTGRAG